MTEPGIQYADDFHQQLIAYTIIGGGLVSASSNPLSVLAARTVSRPPGQARRV